MSSPFFDGAGADIRSNDTTPTPGTSPTPSATGTPYHPHPEKGTNVGAIVGGVVGGVGGAIVLALVGFLFYRLGKKRSQRKGGYAPQASENGDRFEVDDSAIATPYIDSMPLTAAAAGAGTGRGTGRGTGQMTQGGVGGRPVLPPLVTETKHALDSPATTSSSAFLTPTPGAQTRHSDMLLSPGGESWTNMSSHTFGPRTESSVPLTPLEREIKATIPASSIPPSPVTPATGTMGGMGGMGSMGTFGLGAVDEQRAGGEVGAGARGEGKTRPPPAERTRRPRRVAQEEDAGRMEEDLELVPPSYNPEWARERQSAQPPPPHTPTDGNPPHAL